MSKKIIRKAAFGKKLQLRRRGGVGGPGGVASSDSQCNCWCDCDICSMYDCGSSVLDKIRPVSKVGRLNILRGKRLRGK